MGKKLTPEELRAREAGREERRVELHAHIERIKAELAARKRQA